jgi:predicted AAA+ superfamily ATPase
MLNDTRLVGPGSDPLNDVAVLLVIVDRFWGEVFRNTLGKAERSFVNELIDVRNRWAHQNPFSSDDADRALDSAARLLTAVSATEADEIDKMKMELRRVIFDEQVRREKRKTAGAPIESQVTGGLKPWREVVSPHQDVASGRYQQAEFAADIWQVHIGEGSDEYRKPAEFFRRTFLTESLSRLLKVGLLRLSGQGGDPVVQLQTNFGGGKTHSMLALYHLFSGTPVGDLAGIEAILKESGVTQLPSGVKRVVLVGNKISPGNPVTKPDGTVVRTIWGELAYQLGGKKAFARIQADDERATNPGDALRELLNEYGPCLILIDEWVAYARQLHERPDLPGGDFETQFSFAQALTEAARTSKQCLLVISLPASDSPTSPHASGDDEEVGGERGRAALARLRNVVGRVESSWSPASTEEGFEIVRRRLFEPIVERVQYVARDTVAAAFSDLYRTQSQEFPPAYPIHPEIFDRLYGDWSTLVRFQRTRGVLRLMAAVIHSLWERQDQSPLIMPGMLSLDDPRVRDELTRYLPDTWKPVIEKDVDGSNALPLRIDGDIPNLGKYGACRRVARTIYLGSAPTANAANRGIEDRRIRLGCVMPGESPSVFADALRRLSSAATYLYHDGVRYWYATQPTVTKLAEDRAEQLKREPDKVVAELKNRIEKNVTAKGDFHRVHVLLEANTRPIDTTDAKLVVLGTDHPYSKALDNKAQQAAEALLEFDGSTPRQYRNTIVFLAVDETRRQDIDEAIRRYLAWKSICDADEKKKLNLDPQQVSQAEAQLKSADESVEGRLPEAYQWLLVPVQPTPQSPIEWQAVRLTGQEALAVRASRKLRSDELLVPRLAGTRLRMEMDRIPLWRGDHVSAKQLSEDFARYLYLPRITDPRVLAAAAEEGLALLIWRDTFAYADSFDEAAGRYRGLRVGQPLVISVDSGDGLLVKPEVAQKQLESETSSPLGILAPTGSSDAFSPLAAPVSQAADTPVSAAKSPKRFHGTVALNPKRLGRDASRVADEVVAHLEGLVGAEVTVTLEIHAEVTEGVAESVVRTVTENSRALKFINFGFEAD